VDRESSYHKNVLLMYFVKNLDWGGGGGGPFNVA
jgi:hypothetical protein